MASTTFQPLRDALGEFAAFKPDQVRDGSPTLLVRSKPENRRRGVLRDDVVRLTTHAAPCSELGRRPRQELPVVVLLLPVHQDV